MNNHEGLAKRFSMNYMDTVGNGKDKRFYRFLPRNFFNPSDWKRSGKYYLEESNFLKTKLPTPIKRFSMNFLDTLDNPEQKRFSMNYLDSLNNPQQKRFSMNYMDTLKNSKQKKFSMNFLDSLDQQPRRKRFTMNFMDTLGQKGLLSKHQSSLSGHHRHEENGKIFTLQVTCRSLFDTSRRVKCNRPAVVGRECVRNLDLRVQVHSGELYVSTAGAHSIISPKISGCKR